MKSKVDTVVSMTEFNKEDAGAKGAGERQPSGAAAAQGGSTTSQPTTPRRPTGVVVLRSCAVRVPPKKVQLAIEKPKSWCCVKWKKAKVIGTFGFDKQPKDNRVHEPVWTSRRSTLDVDRVLRHQDYKHLRITVHLGGDRSARFYTSMDWLINEVTAETFVLNLNGKYMETKSEMAPVTVTAVRPQCQEKVAQDDHSVNMETQEQSLDGVPEKLENEDEGVKSDDSDTEEAAEEKVVVNNVVSQDTQEEEERWRNVVVVGGPWKVEGYQGVGHMCTSGKVRPNTASSIGQVVDAFGQKVLPKVRRVMVVIMALCVVAVLVDAFLDEDALGVIITSQE